MRANVITNLANRRGKCRRPARRGAAAVEFAITAPIFILFLLSAFEFGWLNVMRHTADNAAYEAARAAMVPGATTADATGRANQLLSAVGARNDHDVDDQRKRDDRFADVEQQPDRRPLHREDGAAQLVDAQD